MTDLAPIHWLLVLALTAVACGSRDPDAQATVIKGGLDAFAASKAIARTYIYELLDDQLPGVSGTTYTPDSGEYHFGLYAFDGTAKPAAASFLQFEEESP